MIAVLSNDEEGGVTLEVISKNEFVQRLNDQHYGENPVFFDRGALIANAQGGGWEFANEGERGHVVFSLDDGLIVPEPVKRVTEWKV